MASEEPNKAGDDESSILQTAMSWGKNPVPPSLLATLIAAQHLRPPQFVPLCFPPVLLFSSYLNLSSFPIDAAGISAAWSGLYLLLARRRKQPFVSRWGPRGITRGLTMGLCVANLVGGGITYGFGKRTREEEKRQAEGS